MAISWATLFGDLGALVGRLNSYGPIGATTLPADLEALQTQLGTRWESQEGLAAYYGSLSASVTGWRQGLASYGDRRLTDRDTVLVQLGLDPYAGIQSVLP